ncbi:hypothetical protein [Streptomyces sp. NPDC008150]|uniref:hypothetical protein n=1 Tax=Streptomyces sp. NPDC008150 TaxID=3364816 RepID=UPI0036E33B05
MSLTSFIPGRKERKHHPDTVIRKLRDENNKLLERQLAADEFFGRLIADRDEVYACWLHEQQARAEAEQAAAQMRMERDEIKAQLEELAEKFGPQLAAEANAHPVTVPPSIRDTTAMEDQATAPIDVQPLWEAMGIAPTSAVTNPGRIAA